MSHTRLPHRVQLYWTESFSDNNWTTHTPTGSLAWYDGTDSTGAGTAGGYSGGCLAWTFAQGAMHPTGWDNDIRRLITADGSGTDSLYISFYWKFASNWEGSQQNYHPHLIEIQSNLDYAANPYEGPYDSATHLNSYIGYSAI